MFRRAFTDKHARTFRGQEKRGRVSGKATRMVNREPLLNARTRGTDLCRIYPPSLCTQNDQRANILQAVIRKSRREVMQSLDGDVERVWCCSKASELDGRCETERGATTGERDERVTGSATAKIGEVY